IIPTARGSSPLPYTPLFRSEGEQRRAVAVADLAGPQPARARDELAPGRQHADPGAGVGGDPADAERRQHADPGRGQLVAGTEEAVAGPEVLARLPHVVARPGLDLDPHGPAAL